jgi:hypothetical protein
MGMFVNDSSDHGEDCVLDELGGFHAEGLGWSPKGVFCGECSELSCVGCKMNDWLKEE